MITATATDVVRATLPVVSAAIEEITPIFYRRMFAAHPELERDLFNRGNQAQGDQQRALAGAIAAYASLLVESREANMTDMLGRIAHKHVSLGITPEQYRIVHRYLFEAIGEVLGTAATPEVVSAWDEVYWDMARALMHREEQHYAAFGVDPGQVWQDLVVRRRQLQSPDTVAFELERADGAQLPPAKPGQYISVQVELADGARQIRQYSLTRAPRRRQWAITVKVVGERIVDGEVAPAGEVSGHLYENLFEGDVLRCSLPCGDLVLEENSAPLLLVSAGIGCTPIIGMLHYLVRTRSRRNVAVLHADQSRARHPHRNELRELVDQLPGARLHHWYEDLGARGGTARVSRGRMDLAQVDVDPAAQVYLCGPPPFMAAVSGHLRGRQVPTEQIHYEVFGPDTWVGQSVD